MMMKCVDGEVRERPDSVTGSKDERHSAGCLMKEAVRHNEGIS